MVNKHHKIVEGAAGVAVASFIKEVDKYEGQTVVIIICGANITTEKLKELL
jgi:threonine dehydratase